MLSAYRSAVVSRPVCTGRAHAQLVLVCFAKGRDIHELTISAKASYRSAKPASSTSFTRASGARPAMASRRPWGWACSFESQKKQIRWRWSSRRFGGPPRDQPRWTTRAQVTTLARQCLANARASISRLSLLTPTGSCTHDPSRMCQTVALANSQLTFRRDLYHTLQGRQSG